jgi:ABC-2 type transporter
MQLQESALPDDIKVWEALHQGTGGTVFTLVSPIILLVVFGVTYGKEPSDSFGGYGYIDTIYPAFIGLSIAVTGFTAIPGVVASHRERGVLRRLRASPVPRSRAGSPTGGLERGNDVLRRHIGKNVVDLLENESAAWRKRPDLLPDVCADFVR